METESKFDLDLAIRQHLAAINTKELLSTEDKDELADYLFSETEHLQGLGLSKSEAFLVSKHRLGTEQELVQEYQKAKPWVGIRNFLFTGFLFGLGAKFMFNSMVISSLGAKVLLTKLPLREVNLHGWHDIVLQISCLFSLGLFVIWLIKTASSKLDKRYLYFIPAAMLVSEIGRMALIPQAFHSIGMSEFGHTQANTYGLTAFLMFAGVLGVCWAISRKQQLPIQLT